MSKKIHPKIHSASWSFAEKLGKTDQLITDRLLGQAVQVGVSLISSNCVSSAQFCDSNYPVSLFNLELFESTMSDQPTIRH